MKVQALCRVEGPGLGFMALSFALEGVVSCFNEHVIVGIHKRQHDTRCTGLLGHST